MHPKLTAEQQQYAKGVFRELLERFPNQKDVASKLNVDQTRVSAGRNHGTVSLQLLVAAAALAGRPMSEVTRYTGVTVSLFSAPVAVVPDPPIGTFLLKINKLPGLDEWLTNHPGDVHVSEVCRAIETYESTPGLARPSDGQPHQGWGTFFTDLRAGKIGPPTHAPGAGEALLAIEQEQVPDLPKSLQIAPPNPPKRQKKKPKSR